MLIVNYIQGVAACNLFGSVRPKTCCVDTFWLEGFKWIRWPQHKHFSALLFIMTKADILCSVDFF